MNEYNTHLYESQTIFIGIDVHQNSWTITEIFGGHIPKTYRMKPSPDELIKRLKKEYPGAEYKSVYEAGFCGFWIHRKLKELGIDNIVINPGDVPSSYKDKVNKNDAHDSKKLARELTNKSLIPIYVPSIEHEKLRDLVRRETQVISNIVRCKNRIKGHLYRYGKDIKSWSKEFLKIEHEKAKQLSDSTYYTLLDELLKEMNLKTAIVEMEKLVVKDVGKEMLLKNLMTIPGIGFRIGITIIAELWDIQRFATKEQLISYVGLAPRLFGSGDGEHLIGASNRKNKALQSKLIEGSWRAIHTDVELRATYGKFAVTRNPQIAISIVAKKLLTRIRTIWIYNRAYELHKIE